MSTTDLEADRALKSKHRAMWALGDYHAIATAITLPLGRTLVEATDIADGDRVLDVAAGTGAVAVPAAAAGGRVLACDLTPELFEAGRGFAAQEGVAVDWQEADAEALPFAEDAFDAVLSCVGVMFAPHHGPAADELVRVCRPDGTLGVLSWTPEGFIGQLFATMRGYLPAPPPGVQAPPLWGDEEHLAELFGDRLTDVRTERRTVTVDQFADAAAWREHFKRCYGPTIVAYRANAEDPERVAALDRELTELARSHDRGDGVMEWEYLLLTARKA